MSCLLTMSLKLRYLFIFATFILQITADKSFICVDGTEIDLSKICNGIADCPDKSDETKLLCYHLICPKGMFRCHYGACVQLSGLCNGVGDCLDKSDESQCGRAAGSCEKSEYKCRSGECVDVRKICDGAADCPDGSDESTDICEEFICPPDTFRCRRGGCVHPDSQCDGVNDCLDGSDESKRLCEGLKCAGAKCADKKQARCPPIAGDRIRVKCETGAGVAAAERRGLVTCSEPVAPGTVAQYECRQHFVPAAGQHLQNNQSVCQLDGTWSRDVLRCEPECGRAELDVVPMVVGGWRTEARRYPWHSTLYVLQDGAWTFWCGGSLISERAVLTAAHCTWRVSSTDMRVAFGKDLSAESAAEGNAQFRNVRRVVTQPLYQDQAGNYGSDLAVLELDRAVDLSTLVGPVCVDWNQRHVQAHLAEGSTGLAVGMGITENETFSEWLRGARLPVVSNARCLSDQKKDFRKYITFTTFCAGLGNGSGVCNGDSGGGLVFPFSQDGVRRWMVQGIVSVSPRRRGTSFCDPQYYTIFTKVAVYVNWLRTVLDSIHPHEVDTTDFTRSMTAYG